MQTLPVTGTSTAVIRVCLFGDARLEDADGNAFGLSPLQLALVTAVYGHGSKGLSRLAAGHLLWGNDPRDRKRHRLRQLLHDLRGRVGAPIVDADGDLLRPVDQIPCDLIELDQAIQEGCLQDAARLLRLGFVARPVIDVDPFDDWRVSVNARLLGDVRSRAARKWSESLEMGDWAGARDAAEALYALDGEDPRSVERVIEARGRTGLVAEAEAAYERYLTCLPEGSSPVSEVAETIQRVRSTWTIGGGHAVESQPPVPLVGRERELATVRAALDRVASGRFEVVLISGESGIGKTRLLDEVNREGLLRGFSCLRAQPVELEQSIPLNPVLDALRSIELQAHLHTIGKPWSSVIAGLLPPGTLDPPPEEPPPIRPSSLSRRLLDSFALLFEQLSQAQPTLLLLDDLQWADATTLATLQFLQRRWAGGPMGIFATVRPDLVHAADPMAKYLTVVRQLGAEEIEVRPLSTEAALELVEKIAGDKVGRASAFRLCDMAGRHPLYLTELTRELLSGNLTLPEMLTEDTRIPASLEPMLDARFESLEDRAMAVAGLLAVAARPLTMQVIASLSGLSAEIAATAVESLQEHRFVEVNRGEVRLAHELFRRAVYRHLSEPRRALYHRAIAEHLIVDPPTPPSGELAVHFARAGDDTLAARYGWIAAQRALEAGAFVEAVGFFEIVAESEHDERRRADATVQLALTLELTRDMTRAEPRLRKAAEHLRSTGRVAQARRLEVRRIEALAEIGEEPVQRLSAGLERIGSEARSDGDWESLALALDAGLHLLHRAGNIPGIGSLLEEMRVLAGTDCLPAQVLCQAGLALGVFFGYADEALQAAQEAVQLADDASEYRLRALSRLMVVLQASGLLILPESQGHVEEARRLAERTGDVLARFSIQSNLAVAHLDAGDVDAAAALMEDVEELAGAGEMDMNRFIQANNEAELALARSEFEEAAQAFDRASAFLGPSIPSYMRDLVNAGLGLCALEGGNIPEARRREELLGPTPDSWYFDPTTLVAFRSRLLERRGERERAILLVTRAAEDLKGRLITAWLKVVLLQVRLLAKSDVHEAKALGEVMRREAQRLRLPHRERDFRLLVERLGP